MRPRPAPSACRVEWVDGIPDGPVVVPDSHIRGGIDADGANVGMYTSIAVNDNGEPSVTYFDRDTGSLKFAQKIGDTWAKHTIQAGTGTFTATCTACGREPGPPRAGQSADR